MLTLHPFCLLFCVHGPQLTEAEISSYYVCHFHYVSGIISECTETYWSEFQVITIFSSLHLFHGIYSLPVGGVSLSLVKKQSLPSACTYI